MSASLSRDVVFAAYRRGALSRHVSNRMLNRADQVLVQLAKALNCSVLDVIRLPEQDRLELAASLAQ